MSTRSLSVGQAQHTSFQDIIRTELHPEAGVVPSRNRSHLWPLQTQAYLVVGFLRASYSMSCCVVLILKMVSRQRIFLNHFPRRQYDFILDVGVVCQLCGMMYGGMSGWY